MRLTDYLVDHVGEWDLVVCEGDIYDIEFKCGKDDEMPVSAREQMMIFRYSPGRKNRFMASQGGTALNRPPLEPPGYWRDAAKLGKSVQEIIQATADEKSWLQDLLDKTYKKKKTRDRSGLLADRFVVVSALRSEHPALWDKYAQRRQVVLSFAESLSSLPGFEQPKTMAASPDLLARCKEAGEVECYLLHGTNPTSAMAILGTSFKVNLAGKTAGTMFGPGVYLAESSSKADEYAKDDSGGVYDGLFAVLVCRAVLGRPFITETAGDYSEKVVSGDFDVVIGDREKAVGTFREFIFFHEASIYPEYAVFYRRELADGTQLRESGAVSAPAMMTMILPGETPRSMNVVVPSGAPAGSRIQATAPDGTIIELTVPEGVMPGSQLEVRY